MSISLKELKNNRLSPPEKWLIDLIEGVEPKKYPDGVVDWFKGGTWLFTQRFKNGYLDFNYNVRQVLIDEFGLNYVEIQELLINILYDYTDNGKLKVVL